jgi:N-acetylmuramoyl-L-alanine amidase
MKIINHLLCNDDGSRVDFKQTPNTDKRKMDLKWLIIHFTAGSSRQGAVNHFSDPNAKASAHLVIGREGAILLMAVSLVR